MIVEEEIEEDVEEEGEGDVLPQETLHPTSPLMPQEDRLLMGNEEEGVEGDPSNSAIAPPDTTSATDTGDQTS